MSANVKWVQFEDHVNTLHKNLYLNEEYTDCVLVSSENRELKANQLILSLASDFFKTIFENQPNTSNVPRVLFPDFTYDTVKHLICFIYTGSISILTSELPEFLDICNTVYMKGMINCDGNLNGSTITTPSIIETLEGVDQVVEFANTNIPYLDDVGDELSGPPAENILPQYTIENDDSHEEHLIENNTEDDTTQDDDEEAIEEFGNSELEDFEIIDTDKRQSYYVKEEGARNYYQVVCEATEGEEFHDDNSKYNTERETEFKDCSTVDNNALYEEIEEFLPMTYKSDMDDYDEKAVTPNLKRKKSKVNYNLDDRLAKAMESVLDGRSLRHAANEFNVPKTVLWRKVCQIQNRIPKMKSMTQERELAMKMIESGETLMKASQIYNVPLSTLHRDKTKLFKEGKLPDRLTVRQRRHGTNFKERVLSAAKACLNGMPQNEASKVFNIPKTTIWRRMKFLQANPTAYLRRRSLELQQHQIDTKIEEIYVEEN